MTRQSLRALLLRAARLLDEAASRAAKPVKMHTTAKELRDAAMKGIRA